MVENAMLMGANAVIGVRFDSSEIDGESPTAHPDWSATDERFRDPSTGRLMRVWLDPAGARHYVAE
jgi:hypothetical protein